MSLESITSLFTGANAGNAGVLTAGLSAIGQIGTGFQKSQALRYNASSANLQADIATQEAQANAAQEEQTWKQRVGAAITSEGASGVDPGQGSPLNVISAMAQQGSLAKQLALYRDTLEATGFRQQAAVDRTEASQYLLAGFAGGGGTYLTGYAKYLQSRTPRSDTLNPT